MEDRQWINVHAIAMVVLTQLSQARNTFRNTFRYNTVTDVAVGYITPNIN